MSIFNQDHINHYLKNFRNNPIEAMQQVPPKLNSKGELLKTNFFTAQDIATSTYDTSRSEIRNLLSRTSVSSRAAIANNDNPQKLTDQFKYETLVTIHEAGLRSAQLSTQPWSGDYWATARGGLASRYADVNSIQGTWDQCYEYTQTHPSKVILTSGSEVWINELSPAEKYDALVGDTKETLTRASWAVGKKYFDAHQEVPSWFGICHGWAPASYMLARPVNSIKLLTPNNLTLTFYPCEIKALCSLLWAQSSPKTRFIGGRCNSKEVQFDPDTGRVITVYNPYLAEDYGTEVPTPAPGEPRVGETEISLSQPHYDETTGAESRTGGRSNESDCFDTNPGTWHLAVVNQLGVSKRSMVMDATFDHEVWNQPLLGYKYTYFNPHTLQQTEELSQATVSKAAFTSDIFQKYRSPKAVSFVGVVMRVSYMVETGNSQESPDQPEYDQVGNVDYYYDLEIDNTGKIIGGEWYTNTHPDFLWTPPKNEHAFSRYEHLASGTWDSQQALPASWRAAALKASADLTPLAKIVEQMVQLSR